MDLLLEAVVTGVLLGCFYAAVSIGLSVSIGLLDVPQVAHPAFLVMASYAVFSLNDSYDIDPLLAGVLITPVLFVFGLLAYRVYYETFERRGTDAAGKDKMMKSENFRMLATMLAAFFVSGLLMTASTSTALVA